MPFSSSRGIFSVILCCSEAKAENAQRKTEIAARTKAVILITVFMSFLLRRQDGDLLRAVTGEHDFLIMALEDAMLTGKVVFDNEASLYEKFFVSRNKKLHEEEVRIRKEIVENASHICKQNKVGLSIIDSEDKIIDATIDLLERYRHGYYGYVTAAF